MIVDTTVGVNDLQRTVRFAGPVFAENGARPVPAGGNLPSWGRKDDASVTRFSIGYPFDAKPATEGNGTMMAFRISAPAKVDAPSKRAAQRRQR